MTQHTASVKPGPLTLRREGAVAIVAINDAPYNRMSIAFIDEFEQVVDELAADDGVRAVLLTAEGLDNFSVGMNLKQLPEGIATKGGAEALFDQRLKLISTIENMGKPWIVTMYGYCLGGGLEIPLGCHFRLAADEGAQIGLPELELGSVPAWGGSARLCKTVGRAPALDMILRSKKVSGRDALAMGLVHETWPLSELKERALALAHELTAQPAGAVRATLDTIIGCEDKTLEQLLTDERRAVLATMSSPDAMEGMMAFMEKRKPVFNQS